jgi:hypothetical protein
MENGMSMSAYDWGAISLAVQNAASADTTVALIAACVLLVGLIAWRRLQALERRTSTLQEQLTVFAEAARRVATHVATIGEQTQRPAVPEGSRRYLVKRARLQLADGLALKKIAPQLGLRRDELKLIAMRDEKREAAES